MMSRRKYSEDDEIYLEYFLYDRDEKTFDVAAEFLGRSKSAIRKKVVRMRKENKDVGYMNRPYSKEEKEFIRKHYHTMTAKNIGTRLGRSRKSVTQKAFEMGLKKTRSLKRFEQEIINMARSGYSDYQIGKELGVAAASVAYYREKNNI